MIPRLIKPFLLSKRVPPLCTILLAPIVIALSIVVVASRGDNAMRENYVVALNTSTLLQEVLKTYPAPVAARAVDTDLETEPPTTTPPPEIDPRQLPSSGDVRSFFQSVGSQLSTAVRPSPTGAEGESGSGRVGSLLPVLGGNSNNGTSGSLRDAFGSILRGGSFTDFIRASPLGPVFSQLGGQAATAIVGVVNGIAGGIVSGMGAADNYSVYLRDMCSANVTSDGSQQLGPRSCSPLRDLSIAPAEPTNSTFKVGNVMIDYSAINIPNKLAGTGDLLKLLFDALFAFQLIGIIASILLLLVSLPLTFTIFQLPALRALAGVLSLIAAIFITLISIIEGLIGSILPNIVNMIGDGLGVSAQTGGKFVALTAVSAAFAGILAQTWIINLIVSYHERTYVRRDDRLVISSPQERPKRPIIRLNDGPEIEKTFSPRPAPRPFLQNFQNFRRGDKASRRLTTA